MFTLCIRYTLNPNALSDFRTYAENEQPVIARCGGDITGYWSPTDYAGATNIAYGFIDFTNLAEYEAYRKRLADDEEHRRNAAALEQSGVVLWVERSFIERIDYAGKTRSDPSSARSVSNGTP